MLAKLKRLWLEIRLVRRTDAAFTMASRGEDELAFSHLQATAQTLGPLTQYRFGIEPALLEIYLRGCVAGIKADDYNWAALLDHILSASEYNDAEKLHLIAYLEELATTAGVSLPILDAIKRLAPTERVRGSLIRRFPKLSDA